MEIPFDLTALTRADWTRLGLQAASKILQVILVLLLARLADRVLGRLLNGLEKRLARMPGAGEEEKRDRTQRIETLVKLLRQAVSVTVWAVAVVVVLDQLGIDIRPILAGAGVVGLAVGFGAQNLVRDVVSGLFIILEDQVSVGDVARINGTGGLVEQVNLRTIVLRDLEGTVHIFPNGAITSLSNLSKGWSAAVIDASVAYREDVDRVVEVMRRVGEEMREDPEWGRKILEPVEILGLERFEESALVVRCRIKTHTLEQWGVGREYRRRLKKAFEEEGIEIPFPHRVVQLNLPAPLPVEPRTPPGAP